MKKNKNKLTATSTKENTSVIFGGDSSQMYYNNADYCEDGQEEDGYDYESICSSQHAK